MLCACVWKFTFLFLKSEKENISEIDFCKFYSCIKCNKLTGKEWILPKWKFQIENILVCVVWLTLKVPKCVSFCYFGNFHLDIFLRANIVAVVVFSELKKKIIVCSASILQQKQNAVASAAICSLTNQFWSEILQFFLLN